MTGLLTGEVALVTGMAGRLGPIWATALRDAGATVIGIDRRAELPELDGVACLGDIRIDLPAAVETLAATLADRYPPLTILVNNAGVDSRPDSTQADTLAAEMLWTNVWGTDLMTRVFGTPMADRGRGVVVNIASLYGLCAPDLRYYAHRDDGWVKDPMYGATKAAVISLTKYYAAKWAPRGVRVNALAPGGVVAPGDPLTVEDPLFVEKYTARVPMGRMCRPDDLGPALVFLASPASSFVTGHCLPLDGGYLCW